MPLLWSSVCFLAGLLLHDHLIQGWAVWLVLLIAGLGVHFCNPHLTNKFKGLVSFDRLTHLSIGALFCMMALGGLRAWWGDYDHRENQPLAAYNNQGEVLLTGWISAEPRRKEDGLVLQLEIIEVQDLLSTDWQHNHQRVKGRARISMQSSQVWQYGDLLQMIATPCSPASTSSDTYFEYLEYQHIETLVYHPRQVIRVGSGYGSSTQRILMQFRQKARLAILRTFPQPEAGLLIGILLGTEDDLPPGTADAFRDTGLTHIIAISGFNLAILAGLVLWVFTRLWGPYWAALASAVVLAVYTAFVGTAPSVVRALVMAVMGMGGHLIGRRQHGLNALIFTAALMCLISPQVLYEVGFQLSFAATFGLVVFAQPLQNWLQSKLERWLSEKAAVRWARPLSEYFLFTLAAQIITLPVIALHFHRLSLSSWIANPLVLPVQPLVLIAGGITTLAALINPLAGKIFMLFSWPFIKYTDWMVVLLSGVKGGIMNIHPSLAVWLLVLVGLSLVTYFLRKHLRLFFQSGRFVWVILILGAAAFSIWSIYAHLPDGRLHVDVLKSVEESNLVIRTPRGKTILIDPRGNMDELVSQLESELSPWDFHLDEVLISSPISSAALERLAGEIRIDRITLTPAVYRAENNSPGLILPQGVNSQKLLPYQVVEVEPGVTVSLMEESLSGTAMVLQYGTLTLLLPNGVDYADLAPAFSSSSQEQLVLILHEEDVNYIPPRVWMQLNPQYVIWMERVISPFVNSVDIGHPEKVSLESDGKLLWLDE